MVVFAILLSGLLLIFPIIVIARETKDRFIKYFGIAAVVISLILIGLQIFIAKNEADFKKSQKNDYRILLSKMINVDEIHKKEREMIECDGSLNSWPMIATEDPSSGQVQFKIRLIGIHKGGAFEYVVIDTDIKGAPEFHPMIRVTRRDNKDKDWYIALVTIPPYILKENPNMIIIAKFTNGYYDINEYKLKDICVDWDLFFPLNPISQNNAFIYNKRGVAQFDKNDFDQAIDNFNKAIQLDPDCSLAYYNRGNTWMKKGRIEKAIADYQEAIHINPNYSLAYYNLARSTAHLKRPKDACKWLRKAIELKKELKENAGKDPVFDVLQENDCF